MRRANCMRFFVAALTIGVCYCMYSIYWNIDLYIYNLRIRSALSPYDTYIAGRVLIYFSLTVKAATLIFISGGDSASSSAKEGQSGFIYNLVES